MIFVLVPGAWSGPWIWEQVAQRLRDRGETVLLPDLTSPWPSEVAPHVMPTSHVHDVVAALEDGEVGDAVLVGHSYSGLVVAAVAALLPERVRRVVFGQAFLPEPGRSLVDAFGADAAHERELIEQNGGWWPPPSEQDLHQSEPDLSDEQRQWLIARLVPQPGRTVTDPVQMARPLESLTATCLTCTGEPPPTLPPHAQSWPHWTFHPVQGGHFCMLTQPDELTHRLLAAAGTA